LFVTLATPANIDKLPRRPEGIYYTNRTNNRLN